MVHVSARPVAYRLAYELEGLLRGVRADEHIREDEVERINRWLADNDGYSQVHPFSELADHLRRVLVDGRITSDEADDLLFVVSKFTTTNPHFDQVRGGLQVLMGLLAGVTTDRSLDTRETRALSAWLNEWSHLRGLWPYEECHAIISRMLGTSATSGDVSALMGLAHQVPVAGEVTEQGEIPPLVIRGLCAMNPEVVFARKSFTFTGDSGRCPRATMQSLVVERGGAVADRVTKKTDYLIVCDGGSPHWAFACYGRKVEQAYTMRKAGHPIMIIHESDFWSAATQGVAGV